jgi:hypothetical protein
MALYLGNIAIGNGNYLGNENITDNNIFVPTTTTTTLAPTTTTTTVFPPQYWNVRQCGTTTPITQLAIQYNPISPTLLVGYAVRPVITPGSTIALPGYENACYELVSTATSGILCGIRAPAASCAQSVCTVLPTTTTTSTTTTSP